MKMINIEGIDAVGKETVSKALEKTLVNKGYKVKRISFPIYEGDFGKCIKDVLMGACGDAPKIDHELMSPLYTLDRIAYFKANIKNLLETYDYLICDRSFYSNFMYQASKIYMKNPVYYNHYTIPDELYNWLKKNFSWEFYDTKLFKCTDVQTFVLSMAEEDSISQLNNRKVTDTNEKNREYLSECKKFIKHMTSVHTKDHSRDRMESLTLSEKHILLYYINYVHNIEVRHGNSTEDIDKATMETVNNILIHLGINEPNKVQDTMKDMSNKFDVNDNVDLICSIAYSLKSFYSYMIDYMGHRKSVIKSVQINIGLIPSQKIMYSVNFSNECSETDKTTAQLIMNHYLAKDLANHKKEIAKFMYTGFPYKLCIGYNGSSFDIRDLTGVSNGKN